MRLHTTLSAGLLAVFCLALPATATIVPFTEDFSADSANWRDTNGTLPLNWASSGGPDGSSYASGAFNFLASAANTTPAILRAQDEFNSSGNAFVGDWIADGVSQLSFYVRHDAPVPLTFFARIANPVNFPAVAAVNFTPVSAGTWTQVLISITPGNPQFFFEGGPSTFTSVFSSVGHIQIGVFVPESLAGTDQAYTFDVDKPSITPEPATAALALLAGAFFIRPDRRSSRRPATRRAS